MTDRQIEWKDMDACPAYHALNDPVGAVDLAKVLDPRRIRTYSVPAGGGLVYNYAAKRVDRNVLALLGGLADQQQLIPKYRALINGEIMNPSEGRRVLHHLTRGQLGENVVDHGRDLGEFYRSEGERVAAFARAVHEGRILGSTGKRFGTVVQIGIGGSDLGPRALHGALSSFARERHSEKLEARFISNVDPDDANEVLRGIDVERSLFILVTKSGTTQESLTNCELVLQRMRREGSRIPGLDPDRHMVAVTSQTSPLAGSSRFIETFFIDDFIGGRYSSSSAVGGVVLSLAFGPGLFAELLSGAHEADRLALTADPLRNAALLDALIGIHERNTLGAPVTAILPYSQALSRFPAHLQQLDMESNGKSVNRAEGPLSYPTGPVVFGEPGTNGQHSFYQLLHQGTDIVPLQFVGFRGAQTGFDTEVDGSTSQEKLNANLAAQIVAFAKGRTGSTPNKHFPGNRPSSLIIGDRLTPKALGALLAHFENKIMFQGFVWNVNSFDQEGVQLGKLLTGSVLHGTVEDDSLSEYVRLLSQADEPAE